MSNMSGSGFRAPGSGTDPSRIPNPGTRTPEPVRFPFKRLAIYILLITGAATMLLPFAWMISTSLKPAGDVFASPPEFLPRTLEWRNYVDTWRVVPFARYFLNTIFVALAVTVGQVATSAMAAYAFARLRFPGRDKLFLGYLATIMIPGSVTMIPVFILMKMMGWVDTYKALIIPGIFSAYGTFMLRQFFLTIPSALEDAARIDGCGYVRTFFNVALPLSQPALATLALFTFMGNWNSFMWPLIVTNSQSRMVLPVGLASFQGMYGTDWALLMAGSVMAIVPVLILFLFNQRFFVEGIKLSGFGGT